MDNCKEHYVTIDYTKFGDDSLSLVAPIAELDAVVTDWRAPADVLAGLQEQGVRVIQGAEEPQPA